MIRLSGDGVFFSVQGEGPSIGKPSVFVRLHYCNLRCKFKDGSSCDTFYTWQPDSLKEMREIFSNELVDKIRLHNCKRIVWTGGEPALQFKEISALMSGPLKNFYHELETNGTLDIDYNAFNQVNCSPKLASSGNARDEAINPSVLRAISSHPHSCFKFVMTSRSDEKEIKALVEEIWATPEQVYIMPEGIDARELEKKMLWMVPIAKRNGWIITPRLQIHIFGNKRRT